ncbi:hypothetical protein NDU88_003097 [Pleurodeles waltl]|uniref:Uncharacterized protein n=1 Tax=Pleurodeles waltl TaxID=8319 RepID=A0AAV7QBS8_PLEWA|nr:hypothetical protein NDU88_003097 [Pleurodeles waltl]
MCRSAVVLAYLLLRRAVKRTKVSIRGRSRFGRAAPKSPQVGRRVEQEPMQVAESVRKEVAEDKVAQRMRFLEEVGLLDLLTDGVPVRGGRPMCGSSEVDAAVVLAYFLPRRAVKRIKVSTRAAQELGEQPLNHHRWAGG